MDFYTQPFTIQLQLYCPAQGVYLRWLSGLGQWEVWLFDGDTDPTEAPEAGNTFQPAQGTAVVLRRPGTRKLLLRAGNLTPVQWEGQRTILTSPQVYIQTADGVLTPVLVTASPASRTSADSRTTFDVEVQLAPANPLTRI
jgi:hypothetical protein